MNHNVGIQNVGSVAWDGLVGRPYDIRNFVRFGWTFEVVAPLAANTIFKIQSAPPSANDDCVPGAFVEVPEVVICDGPAVPAATSSITLPAGTPVGTICAGTIHCRPDAFLRVQPVSGDTADVRITMIRQGPK